MGGWLLEDLAFAFAFCLGDGTVSGGDGLFGELLGVGALLFALAVDLAAGT